MHRKVSFSSVMVAQSGHIYNIITPYIRILDFDWLIAGVFVVYFHIWD